MDIDSIKDSYKKNVAFAIMMGIFVAICSLILTIPVAILLTFPIIMPLSNQINAEKQLIAGFDKNNGITQSQYNITLYQTKLKNISSYRIYMFILSVLSLGFVYIAIILETQINKKSLSSVYPIFDIAILFSLILCAIDILLTRKIKSHKSVIIYLESSMPDETKTIRTHQPTDSHIFSLCMYGLIILLDIVLVVIF